MTPTLASVCRITALVGAPIGIANEIPGRRFIPIVGGAVEGSLNGIVLSGGGDWQTIRADGALDIDAHYILDITGHGTVEVRSEGIRHGSPDVLAALGRGEPVDPSAYYFRTFVRLRTAAPGLVRLNYVLAIAVGARRAGAVELEVFELG